ncbi:ABC transporter ATP-binding protein [Chelativorans xinjiangense]|uniref:ABC transporter ATP-binding protein n=1 Tax=Chelativorans xinjiangense TaxID=2681485 RepID=UPI00135B3DBA|nr:sn-glycerol-3-phosphate ABC transporter ATP-binding protein UgpC [Chelativorans xinjiangense]
MASIEFHGITKSYDGTMKALSDFSLEIEDGAFCVLVGPSGCGKSTALKLLAGLEPANSGRILIDGTDVTDLGPGKRDIAMVFQNYALYPHMSVRSNMGFGLKMRSIPRAEIDRKVEEAARLLELTDYLDRRPRALSGGQRQRVALGRAIVREPKAFLMDEPLSNLDAKLRVQTRSEIVRLQQRLGVTTIYVTHDQTEALTMADKIVVMRDGVIQQIGAPDDLFHTPANIFVAGFIGSPGMNFFRGPIEFEGEAGFTRLAGARVRLAPAANDLAAIGNGEAVFGVRPEHMTVNGSEEGLPLTLALVESLGTEKILHFDMPGAEHAVMSGEENDSARRSGLLARVIDDRRYRAGDVIRIALPPEKIHVFHPETHQVVP